MSRMVQVVITVLALIVVAGASFYGGTVYARGQTQSASAGQQNAGVLARQGAQGAIPNQTGQGGAGRRAFGQGGATGQLPGGMVFGQIEEIKGGILVVADTTGKRTDVHVTETTLIEKNLSVTLADLKPGETVVVSGRQESDGSITARSVQAGMTGRFPGGQPAPGQQPGQ